MQCQQMTLEVNGSESPMMNVHTRAKKEYYDLDCDGCVVADDLGPVDLSKWRRSCQWLHRNKLSCWLDFVCLTQLWLITDPLLFAAC